MISCSQISLSDKEGKELIVNTLKLPLKLNREIEISHSPLRADEITERLTANGYLKKSTLGMSTYYDLTEKIKPYLISSKPSLLGHYYKLTSFNVEFNKIEGILLDKTKQTATIRFSLIAKNVPPIYLLLNEGGFSVFKEIRNYELVFQKFDKGWQLSTDENNDNVMKISGSNWPCD